MSDAELTQLDALRSMFDLRVIKKTLRSDSEEIAIFLFRMTLKGMQ